MPKSIVSLFKKQDKGKETVSFDWKGTMDTNLDDGESEYPQYTLQHALIPYNGRIILVQGESTNNSNVCWEYDPLLHSWNKDTYSDIAIGKSELGGTVLFKNRFLVVRTTSTRSTKFFDLEQKKEISALQTEHGESGFVGGMCGVASCMDNVTDIGYFHGGKIDGGFHNSLFSLSMITDFVKEEMEMEWQWNKIEHMNSREEEEAGVVPFARTQHTMHTWSGVNDQGVNTPFLVLFGGYGAGSAGSIMTAGSHRYNDVHLFDLGTQLWSKVKVNKGSPPSQVSRQVSCVFRDQLIVFGGYAYSPSGSRDSLHMFDLLNGEWKQIDTSGFSGYPSPRYSAAGCLLRGSLYLCGGVPSNYNIDSKQTMGMFKLEMEHWAADWSEETHYQWPREFRETAKAWMMVSQSDENMYPLYDDSDLDYPIYTLPYELRIRVVEQLANIWFQ